MSISPPHAGVTQLVECNLAKVDVAGSNPVSRSKQLASNFSLFETFCPMPIQTFLSRSGGRCCRTDLKTEDNFKSRW